MLLAFGSRSRDKGFVVNSRDSASTGPATSMSSSVAKIRLIADGARGSIANRLARSARAATSIISAMRTKTSSKNVDLTVRIGGRSGDEDVGKSLEDLGTAFGGAATDSVSIS